MKCLTCTLLIASFIYAVTFPVPLHAQPVADFGIGPAQTAEVDTNALRETLIKGLKAAREDQKQYLRQVVKRVAENKIKVSTVYAAFRYARTRAPHYPFPYFKYALATLIKRQND